MVTAEERVKILQMLQDGRISPEAAAELLQAIEQEAGVPAPQAPLPPVEHFAPSVPGQKPRWLHVRVTDTNTGRPRVNVRLPMSLVNLGIKMGARYTPEIEGMDLPALLKAAQESGDGSPFVDVYDEEDGEHVEVFVE